MRQEKYRQPIKLDRRSMHQENAATSNGKRQPRSFLLFAQLVALVAILQLLHAGNQVNSLSLISEKCDPNKVGPDETTVKGGWQAEMFNGLSFRACGR